MSMFSIVIVYTQNATYKEKIVPATYYTPVQSVY